MERIPMVPPWRAYVWSTPENTGLATVIAEMKAGPITVQYEVRWADGCTDCFDPSEIQPASNVIPWGPVASLPLFETGEDRVTAAS
jgi:hypothetical protein